jgi:hypothetical protein
MNAGKLRSLLGLALLAAFAASAQEPARIADEGTIGDAWMLPADAGALAQPAYPAQFAARGDSTCIALGYVIGADGRTSGFQLLKAWNTATGGAEPVGGYWQAFAEAGADAVARWRFEPRPGVESPVPTRTVATIGFTGANGGPATELSGHCTIDGLAVYLGKLEHDRELGALALSRFDPSHRRIEWNIRRRGDKDVH